MNTTILTSTLLTILLGAVVISKLKKMKAKQIVRKDGPQAHIVKEGTPTMGGIMVVITMIIFAILHLLIPFGVNVDKGQYIFLLISTLLIGFIGFWDDYLKLKMLNTKGLAPKKKMLLLLIFSIPIMMVLMYVLKVPAEIRLLFGTSILILSFLKIILGTLVIIATSNAVNLTDGVDGLASTVGILILVFLAGYSIKVGNTTLALFLSSVIGGFIGFLFYNWNKAKVFMGDTGSFLLGGVIAISSIMLGLEMFLPLIAIVPVIEAISVMIQVAYFKKTKKRFFKMAPYHHHLELSGLSEIKVVVLFDVITLIAIVIAKLLV